MLIIIGYGCKDDGINEMIKENFDYKHKKVFIIDGYAGKDSQVYKFKEEVHAKLYRDQINDINKELFK